MKKSLHRIISLALGLTSAAHTPAKLRLAVCFSVLALAFGASQMHAATVTYIVGTCVSGTHFSTIQAALDASPAPDTVEVCPGQYGEQIVITKPVTLEGIVAANGALAQIVLPSGYTNNVTLPEGQTATAQIYVNNVSGGDVNLTNLYVGGQGFGGGTLVGIVYQRSSGTINQVITASQDYNFNPALLVIGFGIYIEGGSLKQSVTVENCTIHDFSQSGIYAIDESATALAVTIKNNAISTNPKDFTSPPETPYDLVVEEGTEPTVSGNVVSGGTFGITIVSSTGSITGNTVIGSTYGISINSSGGSITGNTVSGSLVGISLAVDGASVTSNNIYDTLQDGIVVSSPLEKSVVENNTIRTVKSTSSTNPSGTGIELGCNKVGSQVHSNTIMDSWFGYGDAPAGFAASSTTYVGVVQDVETCP